MQNKNTLLSTKKAGSKAPRSRAEKIKSLLAGTIPEADVPYACTTITHYY